MRRLSAVAFGAVAVAIAAGAAPVAGAQPSDNQWPPEVYVSTAGNVRCVITQPRISCERMGAGFANAPVTGNVASVTRDGTFSWDAAGIGGSTDPANPELPLGTVTPYRWHGWTALVVPDGTRLTNIKTTHGMLVSIDGATITPY